MYLIINKVYGIVSEKNGVKFLSVDKGDAALKKFDQVFAGIKYHIEKISDEEVDFNSDSDKIKFLTDDSLPLGKLIYFPTMTVVIRCVFKQNGVVYPQVYLDDCLYQIYKMISYERIDKSEGIDFNQGENSVKCMICNYYYFKVIGFKYQPYVCNRCHDFRMTVQNLSDIFVVTIKNANYRVNITGVHKKAAVFILKNSDLNDKGVL